jgi:ABC-type branched-subunit amino acid transport system substrate-binding protein
MRARPLALAALAALAALPARPALAQAPAGELLFGMSAPFSGAAKEMGAKMRTGVEVAFAAANARGGVHGRRLRLVAMDDGYEPARTATAVKELVENRKVFGFVGNVGTPTAAVAVPYANEKGVLFFGALTGAALLRNDPPDRYVFNYRASYAQETAAIVRYLVEVRRIPAARIAVFAQDDAFGDSGFQGVAKVMRTYKRDPTKVLRVGYQRNTADVDAAVKAISRAARELQAVVMIATYKPAARFIEKLKDAGHGHLVFTNVSFVGSNELGEELAQLGPGYADGVVVTQVVPDPNGRATTLIRYREELKQHAPGEKPGVVSLEGWIAAQVLVEGLQRAGPDPTVEKVVDALETVRDLDLGIGTKLGFAPSEHQASHKVWGTVMDGKGQLRPIDLE